MPRWRPPLVEVTQWAPKPRRVGWFHRVLIGLGVKAVVLIGLLKVGHFSWELAIISAWVLWLRARRHQRRVDGIWG